VRLRKKGALPWEAEGGKGGAEELGGTGGQQRKTKALWGRKKAKAEERGVSWIQKNLIF